MAALRDELISESTALLSVSSHIRDFMNDRRSERTYLVETNAFFDYIDVVLSALRDFVGDVVSRATTAGLTTVSANLRDLKALQLVVAHLYRFVRQVSDADTLAIPFPIIVYINELLKEFPATSGVSRAKVLLLATDELNFLHRRLDLLRDACRKCSVVPAFPSNIGIIAFPYTERTSIGLNSLLFHELGHFVYQNAGVGAMLASELYSLDKKVDAITKKEGTLFGGALMQTIARERVLSWSEEFFADLLATYMIGPSYAIAFDRLVRLIGGGQQIQQRFSDRHPADLFRKIRIAKLLSDVGWVDAIQKTEDAANADLIESIRSDSVAKEEYEYSLENLPLAKILLESFLALEPKVVDSVKDLAAHLPNPLDQFPAHFAAIVKSLKHLVAPQVHWDEKAQNAVPSAATVLICGSLVLRQDYSEILELCGRSSTTVSDRLWLEDRLSRLVLKGMEDALVLNRWHQS